MKLIFALTLLFAPNVFACGNGGCFLFECLVYGATSTSDQADDYCAQVQVSHLDPNNRTETNFDLLAWELTGAKPPPANPPSYDSYTGDPVLESMPPEDSRTSFYNGVAAFRAEDFEKAIEFFKNTANSERDEQRALYYLGRSYLRASQKGYDGYNNDVIKKDLALKSRDTFRDFAKKYPEHEWAPSAIGLARRGEYLAGDLDGYSVDWGLKVDEALAATPRDEETVTRLFQEAALLNLKDLTTAKHLHPVLWMIRAYYVTRQFSDDAPMAFDLNEQLKTLEADQSSFKKYKDLYAWSRAVLLLKLNRAQEGFELLQKQSVAKTNNGSLSWLVLNARFLVALARFEEARSLIEPYIKAHPLPKRTKPVYVDKRHPQIATYDVGPNLLEDTYARRNVESDSRNFYSMTYVWENKATSIATKKNLDLLTATPVARVFAQGTTPEQMIETISDEKLDAQVRALIEPLVMGRLIVQSKWSEAAKASGLLSSPKAEKDFAAVGKAARTMSENPDDAEANARIGLFIANIEPWPRIFSPCEKKKFAEFMYPMDYYLKALDGFKANDKKKNALEATLLGGMIRCFEDHNGAPHCGPRAVKWDEKNSIPVATRGSWWRRLKSRFPNSKEAKELKVYW